MKKYTIHVACVGAGQSGKTTSMFLLIRGLLDYFSANISPQDYQDICTLTYFKNNRAHGRFPGALEFSSHTLAHTWYFSDAPYTQHSGYLDTREHGYLSDTNILVYCVNIQNQISETDVVLDEILAMRQWIGSRHFEQPLILLVVLSGLDWQEIPTWEETPTIVQSNITHILLKLKLFSKIQFWYNPYRLDFLAGNPIPLDYKNEFFKMLDWLTKSMQIPSPQNVVYYTTYHRCYRFHNSQDLMFSRPNRWSKTQGSNFIVHIPTGKKLPVYFLEKEHRYWTTEIPNTGNFSIYDAQENQYIPVERIPHSPKLLRLENGTCIDVEKKLVGRIIICQEQQILVTENPKSYWDIAQRVILKPAGPKKKLAIYPSGHVMDMESGLLGLYDDTTNIVRFPNQRYFHISTSFYCSIRQLWLARSIAIILAIASFLLLGYIFPGISLQFGLSFQKRQAIQYLQNSHMPVSESIANSLISLLEWEEYQQKIVDLLSQIDPPIPKNLMQLNNEKNLKMCKIALRIMANIRDPDSKLLFVELLTHDNIDIRNIALDALSYLDGKQYPFYLALVESKNGSYKRRQYAALLLGKIATPPAIDLLYQHLKDPEVRVRETALRALLPWKVKKYTREYLTLVQDPSPKVAQLATQSLCKLFPKYTVFFQQVLQLHSQNVQEKRRAIEYFHKNPSRYATPYLVPLLLDDDEQVVRECYRALERNNPRETDYYLNLSLIKTGDMQEASKAIRNLTQFPQSLPYLTKLLSSRNPRLQTAAQEAIYAIRSQQQGSKYVEGTMEEDQDEFTWIQDELVAELNIEERQKQNK